MNQPASRAPVDFRRLYAACKIVAIAVGLICWTAVLYDIFVPVSPAPAGAPAIASATAVIIAAAEGPAVAERLVL